MMTRTASSSTSAARLALRCVACMLLLAHPGGARGGVAPVQETLSAPEQAVLTFYRLLREHRYAEGFAHSIYRDAFTNLSPDDIQELSPDFEATFSDIPASIEPRGVQVSGDVATVFVTLDEGRTISEIDVVQVDGRWLVGDRESLAKVQAERGAFFFNQRIVAHQSQVFDLLERISVAQSQIHEQKGAFASYEEIVATEGFAEEFESGAPYGYRVSLALTPDRQAYSVTAVPVAYGRTGRLSFYSDGTRIHADDARGMAVNERAPVMLDPTSREEAAP